ncbi:protein kinase [Actinomadura sp. 9N407]|uniref:protein kinase domain-containing protein n=1 Tax=Actinomadura sp. 9N407 TaxID=3375154 RepID=UPI0037AE66B4
MAPVLDGDPWRIGVYRIMGRLGAGGMGQVFLGRSPGGLAVAVKVIHEAIAADPGFRARFRREVATARAVSGAFTAAVVDADPDAPHPWLATVFLEGRPLNEAVAGHGPLPPRAVASLGAGLAEALVAIHRAGIVHRDLKPGNVMLSPDGPRVIDFGIAHTTGATAITRSGAIVGTPAYMSPEQARGEETGPQGDVFSLGGVLAFAATGQAPFAGTRPEVTVYRVIHDPPALDAINDPGLRGLIAACLDKDPSRRPTPARLLQRLGSGAPQGVAWLPPSMAAAITEATAPMPPGRGVVGRRAVILAGTGLTALAATGAVAAARRAGDEPGSRGGPGAGPVPKGTLVRRISVGESLAGGPALAQGLAIVTTTSGELHAFDLANGLRRWRYVPAAGESGAFGSAPVAADSTVYAVNDSGYLHAVDVATGKRRWARKAGVLGSPPAVCGGRVYVWAGTKEGGGTPSLAVFDVAGKGGRKPRPSGFSARPSPMAVAHTC